MGKLNTGTPYWKRIESWFLASALLILLSTSAVGLLNWRRFSLAHSEAQQTRELVQKAADLLTSVREAEDSQRGFLLTGRDVYLDPYRRAARSIPSQLKTLRESSPGQEKSFDQLKALMDSKFEELKETVELRRNSGFDAALRIVLTDQGRESMEKIRSIIQRISDDRYRAFLKRTKTAEDNAKQTVLVNSIGDMALSILLFLSAIAVHRGAERREELIGALRDDEVHLRDLRRKAEAAEEQVRNVLESIGDGFISFNREGVISYCNAEAARILGRDSSDMTGKIFWQEFQQLAGAEVEPRYREVAERGQPATFETFLAGRHIWLEESVYPAHDGLSVYFRDVTARKHFEDRTRHTQKLESLGILAGGIAHDFNNLLTAILGSASLIIEDLPPDSPLQPFAENVINASERATQLTRQMLAYSGRGRFVVEPLDLAVQVREITALLEASMGAEVELILDLQTTGVLIEADSGQIQQLIMNLVINGAEAIGAPGGSVLVSTRLQFLDEQYVADNLAGDHVEPGEFLLLEVHDTGHGMDESTVARIFDPFFTTKFTGRGLGLAAVLGIVRGHRGALKVYSHPGQGTTFKVFFPAARGQLVPRPQLTAGNYYGDATVLVVDDEDVVQNLATSTLERYGYKVLIASNGKEALKFFEKDHAGISLVILDMTMPVMSGEETLANLLKIQPDLRVIASSGYNEIEAMRRFGKGIQCFLQKPYRALELAEKVKLTLS